MIEVQWVICLINSIDKTKHSFSPTDAAPHAVSKVTNPLNPPPQGLLWFKVTTDPRGYASGNNSYALNHKTKA